MFTFNKIWNDKTFICVMKWPDFRCSILYLSPLGNTILINQLDMSRQEKFLVNNLNHKIMH